jgi:hypothetical protein
VANLASSLKAIQLAAIEAFMVSARVAVNFLVPPLVPIVALPPHLIVSKVLA